MKLYKPHSFCSFCGHAYAPSQGWPKQCQNCGKFTYRNPIPVGVLVVPVGEGVLCIRRNIEPQKGWLALPGGYIDYGEDWRIGSARELLEETMIVTNPKSIRLLDVISPPSGRQVLIFGQADSIEPDALSVFSPSSETSEIVVTYEPIELAFSSHTEVLAQYFAQR